MNTAEASVDYEKQAEEETEREAELVLAQWRRKALIITLIVTLVAGIPSLVTATIGGIEFIGMVLFIALALFLLASTVLPNIRNDVRVWIFLLVGLYAASINMWFSGLAGTGGVFLIVLPVYGFVLAGSRAGWITASLSLLVFIVFSLLVGLFHMEWPAITNPNSLYRWISAGTVGGMLMINAVLLLHNYTRLQMITLKAEREASAALRHAYDATLEGWAKALELRDHETEGHSRRVTELTLLVAGELGVATDPIAIYRGALLHDIGKMGIPDNVLLKPARLTDDEWKVMRQHPGLGYDLLAQIGFLSQSLDIPRYHHEKWDGSGYPQGLKGEQIPLAARIFSVVDVWDALTSDRPYRKAMSHAEALAYIREHAGIDFDPRVVKAFEPMISQG